MTEYRDIYPRITEASANLFAIAVDPPAASESVRQQLKLPFPILSDIEKRVIREWGILNEKERGGIATPAVFVIGAEQRIRYRSVDTTTSRIPALSVVSFLAGGLRSVPAEPVRSTIVPGAVSFGRALRNQIQFLAK